MIPRCILFAFVFSCLASRGAVSPIRPSKVLLDGWKETLGSRSQVLPSWCSRCREARKSIHRDGQRVASKPGLENSR